MVLSVLIPAASASWRITPSSNPFTDVQPNQWHHDYVSWAWINGITTGTTPTTFAPDSNVTRAQFSTFIHRVAGTPTASRSAFADSGAIPNWAVTAVGWASSTGVATGFLNDNTYRPGSNITREQISTMLYRYAQNIGLDMTVPENALNAFPDSGKVSDWATTATRWAVHHRIITGLNGNIAPQSNATRAQTVTMLSRFVNTFDVSAVNLPPPPDPNPPPVQTTLIGTWYQRGFPYYVFRADGTGFERSSENIWWYLPRDGVAAICSDPDYCRPRGTCAFPQEWNYSISGSTLTLKPLSYGTATTLTSLPTQPLRIAESGYSIQSEYSGRYGVHYAIYINNPNTHIQSRSARYRVTAYDAAGAVLATQDNYIWDINPQQTNVYAGREFTDLTIRPERVEFVLLQPNEYGWRDSHEFTHYQPLSIELPSLSGDNIVGSIRNPNNQAIDWVNAVVVFRDSSGNILGGGWNTVRSLPANGTAPFSIWVWGLAYTAESFEVYAYPN